MLALALMSFSKFLLERHPEIEDRYRRRPLEEQYAAARTPRILLEVAPHRLAPIFYKNLEGLGDLKRRIAMTSPIDILVHSRGENPRPLLAIEVDGAGHADPAQQVKDRAKDDVLLKFGIPLIRITKSDADFWSKKPLPLSERQKLRKFSYLVTRLAIVVSSLVTRSQRESLELDQVEHRLHEIEDKTAQSLFGAGYVQLDDKQRRIVEETILCSREMEDYVSIQRELSHFRAQDIVEAKEMSEWPSELGVIATAPQIHGDISSGVKAITTVHFPDEPTLLIETPSIRLISESLDVEVLGKIVVAELVQACAEEVQIEQRRRAPARRS